MYAGEVSVGTPAVANCGNSMVEQNKIKVCINNKEDLMFGRNIASSAYPSLSSCAYSNIESYIAPAVFFYSLENLVDQN